MFIPNLIDLCIPRLSQSVRSEADVRVLEQEVARLSQELQEEQRRQGCLEETQVKAREEYARYLGYVSVFIYSFICSVICNSL